LESVKGRDHLEDPGIDGTIILKDWRGALLGVH
jgi:hypothetical protein